MNNNRLNPKLIISLTVLGLALIFLLQNTAVVTIRFLFWDVAMSRAVFMLVLLIIGLVAGWLLHSYYRVRKRP